ncbi:MAG: hypothetical protein ACREIT_10640 [Tepidisphaeraceae bacterium]
MKATIEMPDDLLYRQVKARSALQGRTIRADQKCVPAARGLRRRPRQNVDLPATLVNRFLA